MLFVTKLRVFLTFIALKWIVEVHIGQSYFPAPSGELEMTSNRKLQVGPS